MSAHGPDVRPAVIMFIIGVAMIAAGRALRGGTDVHPT